MKYRTIVDSTVILCLLLAHILVLDVNAYSAASARALQLEEIASMLPLVQKKMGWRNCNSWFKWRCGKPKVLDKKIVNSNAYRSAGIWH